MSQTRHAWKCRWVRQRLQLWGPRNPWQARGWVTHSVHRPEIDKPASLDAMLNVSNNDLTYRRQLCTLYLVKMKIKTKVFYLTCDTIFLLSRCSWPTVDTVCSLAGKFDCQTWPSSCSLGSKKLICNLIMYSMVIITSLHLLWNNGKSISNFRLHYV